MFVIDSFHPGSLGRCLERGLTPALSFFKKRGYFTDKCVSVFPTMTPTCASSIITGTDPSVHNIPGFVWFNRNEGRIVNYGISPRAVVKIGFHKVIRDLLFNLNCYQLSRKVKTVYELVERAGLSAGAVNPFIYRGNKLHSIKIPVLLKLVTALRLRGTLRGPGQLHLGSFCPPDGFKYGLFAGYRLIRKFGVNDCYSGAVAAFIIKSGKQPDFLSVYLPDTDGYAHRHRPDRIESSLMEADRQICKILDCYDDWEQALRQNTFIVAGDHSQSLIGKSRESLINLVSMMGAYSQAKLNEVSVIHKDIAICPNERMAYIYVLRRRDTIRDEIVSILSNDPRIDQVAWKDGQWYRVARGGDQVNMSFRPGGQFYDHYNQGWVLAGNPGVLDIITSGQVIKYGNYPDALGRIRAILDTDNAGDIVVTARQGCEFSGDCTPDHRGAGSHGSLHRVDSNVPLFITGIDGFRRNPRLTDLAPFILDNLGLPRPC